MSSPPKMIEKILNSTYMYHLSFILPFLLFIVFLCKWLSTTIQNLPPSPPRWPILGHLHKLGMSPHRYLRSLSERYGDLMLIYLGNKPTIIVSSARVAKEIMKTHDASVSSRLKLSIYNKLLYNCSDVAGSPYGEYWRQMKSIFVLHLLSSRRVRSFRDVREEETALLMEKIQQNNGSVVNLSELFANMTYDVICRVAFGGKHSGNQQSGADVKEVLKEFEELIGLFNVGDFIPWLAWVNRFNGINKRLEKVSKGIDLILEAILAEHEHLDRHNQAGNRGDGKDENKGKDFVDVLLEVQKENSAGFHLERESIKGLILDAFAAGTDTTSAVLEWTMTEILRNPRIMEQLQKEVRRIAGDKDQITEDDLEKMKYLKAVIKESLRLHPPIPLLVPRESTQDIKIDGYDIAAKTCVMINAWAIQRDPLTWEEPEEFFPERFLNSEIDFRGQDFELIPFGGGRRICPAISFAMTNNEFVLANLMLKFKWTFPGGVNGETLDICEGSGLTIHKKTPLLVVATPHLHQ
ncbi:cytochrome P450 736A117 [Spinacia oleracea]|uniref:Cytochrome P450 736A117 n=1 Tax=Spinacia oleracea TaxID=3562 RepID=A0A9R0JAM6_SPIOL|nr:cytochrome P450 736A117-like [Spinacia oleracea]